MKHFKTVFIHIVFKWLGGGCCYNFEIQRIKGCATTSFSPNIQIYISIRRYIKHASILAQPELSSSDSSEAQPKSYTKDLQNLTKKHKFTKKFSKPKNFKKKILAQIYQKLNNKQNEEQQTNRLTD